MRILIILIGMIILSFPLHAQSSKKRKMEAEALKADAYAITECRCKAGTARIIAAETSNQARVNESAEFHRHLDLLEARLTKKYEADPGKKAKYEKVQEEARQKLTSCQKMLNARRGGDGERKPGQQGRPAGRKPQQKPNK